MGNYSDINIAKTLTQLHDIAIDEGDSPLKGIIAPFHNLKHDAHRYFVLGKDLINSATVRCQCH
jgi:hypothetical protein